MINTHKVCKDGNKVFFFTISGQAEIESAGVKLNFCFKYIEDFQHSFPV